MTAVLEPRAASPVTAGAVPAAAGAAAPGRDRFVDGIRALCTLAVVGLHWLMPVVTWDGERLHIGNIFSAGAGWAATWVLQIMPLMFFAAGCATYRSLRKEARGTPGGLIGGLIGGRVGGRVAPWAFLRGRLTRLLGPVVVFLAAAAALAPLLLAAGVPAGAVQRAAKTAPQLLWFVVVYILVLALAPWLMRAHDRFGWRVPVALGAAVALVDVVRFATDLTLIGYLNAVTVWVFAHQLGFFYADGSLGRISRGRLAAVGVGGVGVLAALVLLGPYPASMVGLPGAAMSNMNPPTICIVVLAVYQLAFALLLRPLAMRALARRRVSATVDWVQRHSMTLYLWHLTALFTVYGVLLIGLDLSLPEAGTATWWLTRPLWLGGLGVLLACLVRIFRAAEQRGLPVPLPAARRPVTGYLTSAAVAGGLLWVVATGVLPA